MGQGVSSCLIEKRAEAASHVCGTAWYPVRSVLEMPRSPGGPEQRQATAAESADSSRKLSQRKQHQPVGCPRAGTEVALVHGTMRDSGDIHRASMLCIEANASREASSCHQAPGSYALPRRRPQRRRPPKG